MSSGQSLKIKPDGPIEGTPEFYEKKRLEQLIATLG